LKKETKKIGLIFEFIKELPPINGREQQHLIKEAITDYFVVNEYVHL